MKDEPPVFNTTFELYLKGEYSKAYDLLSKADHISPGWLGRAYEIRMCLAALMAQLDLAEDILQTALDAGYFYNDFVLRKDDDVKSLQGRPRFEGLVKQSFNALAEAQSHAEPELKIIEPALIGDTALPFLMGLHGNNSHVDGFSDYWGSLTKEKWLIALPQSSQVSARGLFVWNDFDRVDREIPAHYETLSRNYKLDPQKSVIAGFSKGGHAAIHSALKGLLPVRGFLGLAPYVGDLSLILPLLGQPGQKHLRGYFVLGAKDTHCTPGSLKLVEILNEHGIQCDVEIIPDMEHDIPEEFDPLLARAIQFILN